MLNIRGGEKAHFGPFVIIFFSFFPPLCVQFVCILFRGLYVREPWVSFMQFVLHFSQFYHSVVLMAKETNLCFCFVFYSPHT